MNNGKEDPDKLSTHQAVRPTTIKRGWYEPTVFESIVLLVLLAFLSFKMKSEDSVLSFFRLWQQFHGQKISPFQFESFTWLVVI